MRFARFTSCVAVSGLFAAPLPAAAQNATDVFKPAGQWALDYGENYCRLSRTFSDGFAVFSQSASIDRASVDSGLVRFGSLQPFRKGDSSPMREYCGARFDARREEAERRARRVSRNRHVALRRRRAAKTRGGASRNGLARRLRAAIRARKRRIINTISCCLAAPLAVVF